MRLFKSNICSSILLIACFFLNGCALLSIPFQVAKAVGNLAGTAFSLAQAMPTPPPWVFF